MKIVVTLLFCAAIAALAYLLSIMLCTVASHEDREPEDPDGEEEHNG